MNNPLFSIIIPSYNQGHFINETIQSCLSQDYRPIEIIVVDGASQDQTVDILKTYDNTPEVRWISEPDAGVADAVNKGMNLATGEIAAIQSSDDRYEQCAFSTVFSNFRDDPKAGIVYGDCITVNENGQEIYRFSSGNFSIENFLSKETIILQPAAFFRLKLAREVGGWKQDFFNADTEMWLRMIMRAPACKIDSFLACRRMHSGQRDLNTEKIIESYRRMMDSCLEIRQGPMRWKRAAACGKYLHAAHYTASAHNLRKRWYLWCAVISYPWALSRPEIAGTLLPGYYAIRKRYRYLVSFIQSLVQTDG